MRFRDCVRKIYFRRNFERNYANGLKLFGLKNAIGTQEGFTLIELMIVVAILGVLVSIGGPMYERYQGKARQSEAKLALGSIYSLEKSFYSEYGAYIGDLGAIGYEPEGLKRFYAVGFSASWTGSVSGFTNPSTTIPYYDRINYPSKFFNCAPITWLSGSAPVPAAVDGQTLLINAAGQVRNGLNCDYWRMTHGKVLTNPTPNY